MLRLVTSLQFPWLYIQFLTCSMANIFVLFIPFAFGFSFVVLIADSVIGIRSNYNVNDQLVNPDINASNLSALGPSTSNMTVGDGVGLHSHVNQNQLIYDKSHEKSPQKILESVNVHAVDSQTSSSAKLTAAPPTITVTPTDDTNKTIDGMLDRISHDLDYLLNRMAEIPPAPPPPTSTAPIQPLHPTNLSVHEVILEEEAEDL